MLTIKTYSVDQTGEWFRLVVEGDSDREPRERQMEWAAVLLC